MPTEKNEHHIRLVLDPERYKQLRIQAAAGSTNMAALAQQAVHRFLAQQPVWRPEEPGRERRGK
jgi:hypothetical protein